MRPVDPRIRVFYVAESPDRCGPAGDLITVLPRLEPGRHAAMLVLPGEPGPGALRIQRAGAMVHALDFEAGEWPGFWKGTLALRSLVRLMKEFGADIAHGLDERSSALVAVAGRIAGVPILVGTWREHVRRPIPAWRRSALRRLDRLVVPTEAAGREASGMIGGGPPPFTVVPPGLDPTEVRGCARSAEFSEPRPRVGTIAHLVDGRGIETLIQASSLLRRRLPDLEWLVLGTGRAALRYLRMTQAEPGGGVRLLGDRDDVGATLAALDAYASPDGVEALPRGLLQALAVGLPCVAARNPSVEATLVDGRDALLVPPGDAPALADALERVLSPRADELRNRLRAAGPPIAGGFSDGAAASAIEALYERAMADARIGGDPGA